MKSQLRTAVENIFNKTIKERTSFLVYIDRTNPHNESSTKYRMKIVTWDRFSSKKEKEFIKKVKDLSSDIIDVKYNETGDSYFKGYCIYTNKKPSLVKIDKFRVDLKSLLS